MRQAGWTFDIRQDDLGRYAGRGPACVTFGETMIRDTPADNERLERANEVWVSPAGSELTVAVALSRLGMPAGYITRVPDNPYGWKLRDVARAQGVAVEHWVWAGAAEPIGRFLYELGRTPRPGAIWYQRQHSAASKLEPGMVDWQAALRDARLFHTSGITFGLSTHSGYERNYLLEAFREAVGAKPADCLVGLDFNYRSTLWSVAQARETLTPVIVDHVDILITTIQDMAQFYGMGYGRVSAEEIVRGGIEAVQECDLPPFLEQVIDRFRLRVAAITMRHPDSLEQHRWESAALDDEGHFCRSPAPRPIVLADRLGGGDTWAGGFYYGLLSEGDRARALAKGVLVGDAASRLQQTLMFDLPVISKEEVQALLAAEQAGVELHTVR